MPAHSLQLRRLVIRPQAVGEDSRLRAFFPDASLATGLLFGCQDANLRMEAPLGEGGLLACCPWLCLPIHSL